MGLDDVEIGLELEGVQAVAAKPMDDVGVHLFKDEHVDVVVEHVAGSAVEMVKAEDITGEGFKNGWLENPSLLVEGRFGEDCFCSI